MTYEIIKTLHIVSVISWMAGMLYLPRLFVYHAQQVAGSETSEQFKIMERKLLRLIMNPAMIATWVFGVWLMVLLEPYQAGWMHTKLGCVLLLTGVHHMLVHHMKKFAHDENTKPARYFRWLNEAPTVLMIAIVALVVIKPF